MNKKIGFLWICLCLSLCGCQREAGENESVSREETAADEEGQIFLDKYNEVIVQEDAKRAALIYLDEDSVPELLILKNGEYKLYSFDGSEVRALVLPDGEIKANAYGPVHDFEESEYQTFYWFEYVPYEGLIRVHSGQNQERHDYYLKYAGGLFSIELETKSVDFAWYTYDGEKEITNEEFLSRLSELGYGKLIPCSYLYEDVTTAYKNISAVADTQRVLEDFVSGKTDALDYVVEIGDIPEDGFVMRSYEDFYDDITEGEDEWGSVEYIDFDNDGDRELILHGYTGACLFFDVTGDTVYKVLRTGSTTDVASVVEIEGRKAIQRTDLTHGGRKSYRIMKFDSCCCLIDWFHLYAEYEGTDYTEEDRFTYRNREISMEEYEAILEGLRQ